MSQLKTYIWVDALRIRAQGEGAFVYIARKGDRDAGVALLKVAAMDGSAVLYVPERNLEISGEIDAKASEHVWRASDRLPEREIDALIQRRAQYDPDIWIIEVEDKQGLRAWGHK